MINTVSFAEIFYKSGRGRPRLKSLKDNLQRNHWPMWLMHMNTNTAPNHYALKNNSIIINFVFKNDIED